MERDDRMQWKGRFEFLFTAFGYTIGLGNIWRFPHKCFVNGGGAFLIPYLLSVLLCTIPMLFLEMSLGQFVSEGPVTVWKMNPLFTGVGWAILFNAVMTNVYYIIIVMYTFYYMLVSFVNIGSQLPWERCTEEQDWSTINCRINPNPDLEGKTEADKILEMEKIMDDSCVSRVFSSIEPHLEDSIKSKNEMDFQPFMSNFSTCLIEYRSPAKEYWIRFVLGAHKSKGMDDLGHIELRNVLILFTIWLLVYYCCIRGIRSIAKFIFLASAVGYTKSSYDGKEIPGSGEAIGLLLIITPTLIFLGVTILQIYRYKGVRPAMKPSVDWQPRYMVNRTCRYGQSQPIDDNYITASEINEACEDPPPPVCNQPVEKTTQL